MAIHKVLSGLLIIICALGLLQLWFNLFSIDMLIKVIITLIVVGGVIVGVYALKKDFHEEEQMKKDKYMDS